MSEIKTIKTDLIVDDFLEQITNEKRKNDILKIRDIFGEITKEEPCIWSNEMIGYGTYHYKSLKSTQEGNWPLTAFSNRKQNITIYIMPGVNNYTNILDRLGKHKRSKGSCLYINKLADINIEVFKELLVKSFYDMKKIQGS